MRNSGYALVITVLSLAACAPPPTPDVGATVLSAVVSTMAADPTRTPATAPSPAPLPTYTPMLTYTPLPTLTPSQR